MRKPLFDSKSEKRVFTRLDQRWSRYVDIYPHIPVRNVLGFEELRSLDISDRAKDYLLKTEFDFVVCEQTSAIPQLAVEFDGIGHGLSRDGGYVPVVTPINDRHRKLKLDAKLSACEALDFPLVIVSYPETEPLWESEDALMILDAIIGEVLGAIHTSEVVTEHMDEISSALEHDQSGEDAGWKLFDIEMESQLTRNPIRRKTAELSKKIPVSGLEMQSLRDRPGYVGGRFTIQGGIHVERGIFRMQDLVSVDVYLRDLNCPGCSAPALLESVGEYLLVRKALHKVGINATAWRDLMQSAPWVER